jgi:uncharacterized protein YqjF (DUF2071 family)
MSARPTPVFLTAEWRWLAMLNYEIAPDLLAPFVPAGTELDFHQGRLLASVVGFLFQKARVCGISIPFHRNFEEVNLRFYVRRKVNGDWRRGVVFIKELVPRTAIAWAARTFYNENYTAMPMSHHIEKSSDISEGIKSIAYHWRFGGHDQYLKMTVRGQPAPIREGTEQEFITEHYWGYAVQRNGTTIEYQVKHPRWRVWETESASLHCAVTGLYGEKFCGPLSSPPASAFLAEGSVVKVFKGVRLVS